MDVFRFGESGPSPSASPAVRTRSKKSPKPVTIFNGLRWDAYHNVPEVRLVCALGPPVALPVHFDPTLGRSGRSVPCGPNCTYCEYDASRDEAYVPATFVHSSLVRTTSTRIIWHIPAGLAEELIFHVGDLRGKVFEVFRHRHPRFDNLNGELVVSPLNKSISQLPASFDPRPFIRRAFGFNPEANGTSTNGSHNGTHHNGHTNGEGRNIVDGIISQIGTRTGETRS